MGNVLETIVADKRIEVAQQKQRVSLEELERQGAGLPACRDFFRAVTKSNPRGINVIAEVKKASPSAGLIRQDFDAVEIARLYEQCGADAISVLTDEKYFQGRLDYLSAVKKAVAIPVMRKEFIIEPYQVFESRAAGADAILLIGDVLTTGEARDLMGLARELTLSVLFEVHDLEVFMRVQELLGQFVANACVLGINNRNLTTMEVDLHNTGRLAALLDNPPGLVAESGIKTRAHVELLKASGATACLIGQALCEQPDIAATFAGLFGD